MAEPMITGRYLKTRNAYTSFYPNALILSQYVWNEQGPNDGLGEELWATQRVHTVSAGGRIEMNGRPDLREWTLKNRWLALRPVSNMTLMEGKILFGEQFKIAMDYLAGGGNLMATCAQYGHVESYGLMLRMGFDVFSLIGNTLFTIDINTVKMHHPDTGAELVGEEVWKWAHQARATNMMKYIIDRDQFPVVYEQ